MPGRLFQAAAFGGLLADHVVVEHVGGGFVAAQFIYQSEESIMLEQHNPKVLFRIPMDKVGGLPIVEAEFFLVPDYQKWRRQSLRKRRLQRQ